MNAAATPSPNHPALDAHPANSRATRPNVAVPGECHPTNSWTFKVERLKLNVKTTLFAIATVLLVTPSTRAESPSFRKDIMPILFRAGCNAGTCHGSARGKDGFMLSLFGYDAKGDYNRIVNQMVGRRINLASPENSLLVQKATGSVPHTGGELFTKDSEYYQTLIRWIQAGAPDDDADIADTVGLELSTNSIVFDDATQTTHLKVTAIQSDNTRRDVTTLARFHSNNASVADIDEHGQVTATKPGDTHVFARFSRFTIGAEVIVLPSDKGFKWSDPPTNNYIDDIVFDRLQKLRIVPSKLADDETFLRRVTLDLAARTPTPDEYHAFIADTGSNKRSRKIEELLNDDTFADLWTAIWSEQLRIIGGNYAPVGTHVKAAEAFQKWIQRQLRKDRPLNEFVADMVTASGSNLRNGPSNLYTMLVHAPRINPKALAADFSQLFLGIQIQCAECHNHPFDRWTMDDYYGFVSFFVGMKRKPGVESRERRIYYDTAAPPARHIVDQRPMHAKILGAVTPVDHNGDPRPALADWIKSPDNDIFARNIANRIWAQLLGRGVVEPVDDMRVSNPPSNGPLLDALSERLVDYNYSLRGLVRDICNSRVYQLDSQPNASNKLDTRQFSHAYFRRLRADVLLDSIVAITGQSRNFSHYVPGTRAIDFYPRTNGSTERVHFGDQFFETFGRASRASVCACETKSEPTLSQTLHLTVGNTIEPRLISNPKIKSVVGESESTKQAIEDLFILALSRKPTEEEAAAFESMIKDSDANLATYEDIFWALLNSTEFMFNH